MTQSHTAADCPFCAILSGDAPGNVISRDDAKGFALLPLGNNRMLIQDEMSNSRSWLSHRGARRRVSCALLSVCTVSLLADAFQK